MKLQQEQEKRDTEWMKFNELRNVLREGQERLELHDFGASPVDTYEWIKMEPIDDWGSMRHHSPRLHRLNMNWMMQYLHHVTADHVSRPITITVLGPFLIKVENFRNKDHSTFLTPNWVISSHTKTSFPLNSKTRHQTVTIKLR